MSAVSRFCADGHLTKPLIQLIFVSPTLVTAGFL